MNHSLSICSWLEPFPHSNGVAVVFDIFRCSTTVHTLFARRAGPVEVAPSLEAVRNVSGVRQMRVFSELTSPLQCRERFDNSPHQAAHSPWPGESSALVATTTGTPAMFAARNFRKVYVGSLVNFSALVSHLTELEEPITLIPAAFPEAQHVEDEITAQSMATALEGFANIPDFVRQCAQQARERILASGRPEHLSRKLSTGKEDVAMALAIDSLPQVLWLDFEPNDNPLFARVRDLSRAEER